MKNKQFAFALFLVLISIITFGFIKNFMGGDDNKRLEAAIKAGAYLIDVRTPEEFAEGSVKGAVNIPLDRIEAEMASLKNKKEIVVFCRSGSRSSKAKAILEENGFKNILNGGSWENVKKLVK